MTDHFRRPLTGYSTDQQIGGEWGEHGRRLQFLRRVQLFASCSPETLGHLATALEFTSVSDGTVICRQGDPGDAMYLIEAGTVSVATFAGQESVELARLGPGQFFGEQSLLSREARSATVRAVTPVTLWALSASDFLEIASREPGLAAAMETLARQRTQGRMQAVFEVERHNIAALAGATGKIRIGRAQDNDLVFDSPTVSRYHAVVEHVGEVYQVRDLNSANGTFVNGARVRSAQLMDGNEVWIANERFVFDRREIHRFTEPRGVAIDVSNLSQTVKNGKQLLHDINLSILPGEFVAIVGGSGAGKTTLMDAMSGVRPASGGAVNYNGRDYYRNLDLFRTVLGYVPQDDIIHTQLPLRRTLYHAARLRLPHDTSEEALHETIDETIDALGLRLHADTRVGRLSGGQRKRSSIGVEFLSHPRVFFLDEPTSGLDPATETQLMGLMRRMADDGATVLTTTHATKNLMLCDKVVFLARDGYLAFAGSPRRALQYFGAVQIDDIYERLETEASPEEWGVRFQSSPDQATLISDQIQSHETPTQAGAKPRRRHVVHPAHQFRQFSVLTRRAFEILAQSHENLFALIGQPIVITLLLMALYKPGAWASGSPNPIPAVQTLLGLAFAAFFFGATFSLNSICDEWVIFFRERMVNLGIAPYVISKVAVLTPFLLLSQVILIAALRFTDRLPAAEPQKYAALFVTLMLTEAAGVAIALLVSSLVPGPHVATRLLPVVLLPQVLFSGGFVAVHSMQEVGKLISAVTAMRWSFEATGKNLDVSSLVSPSTPPSHNPILVQFGDIFSGGPGQNWIILAAFVVVPIAATCVTLTRKSAR